MNGPVSIAIAAECIVLLAIFIFAAVLTNAGAIGAAVERMGWF